ncbi:MAG: cupin domain-containing protein [Gammaproteobacteria bacterium]|nr:cupin domain-containing protein [Gammaproteobacteria bacterium]
MKTNQNAIDLKNYRLQTTRVITPTSVSNVAIAHTVDKDSFPALNGVTCYTLEIWEESMRLPHWHPNASELGYVISGSIEVILWRSPGESAVFTLTSGMCWFIPQAALHCLNNIGKEHAKLLVGFSADKPQDIDLHVAMNGIPALVRDAYTSPHTELQKWSGTTANVLVGKFHPQPAIQEVLTASPYGFDLAKVTPLFQDEKLGSVIWGVKSNWNILENISMLRARLKPGVARDPIWYPDAGTLYVVSQGVGQFNIIVADSDPFTLDVEIYDYIFVSAGVLHTFMNVSDQDFEVTAFFTKADPLPEVSLAVSTAFFPGSIIRSAMTEYGNENKSGDPLKDLKYKTVSPYLLKINK